MLCLRCRVSAKQLARTPYGHDRGVGNEWRHCGGSISASHLRSSGNGRAQVFVPICRLVWLVTWSHRHRVADSAATPTFRSSFHLADHVDSSSFISLSSISLSTLHSPFSLRPTRKRPLVTIHITHHGHRRRFFVVFPRRNSESRPPILCSTPSSRRSSSRVIRQRVRGIGI